MAFFALNPLVNLHGLVTRTEVAGDTDHTKYAASRAKALSDVEAGTRCEPRESIAEDAITVEEALRSMTIGSAYALVQDEVIGSLKTGKFADLVILDADPREVDPNEISNISVLETWMGGRRVYAASS